MLANRNSASASEIVTGALQDHDRAYIVGETTFGKALVQSVYRISGGAGLALTTAHYYTPSGRLIQRPWDGTFDEYLSYTLRDQDAEQAAQPERPEAHRRRAARSTAAAASSPTSALAGPVEGLQPDGRFGRMLLRAPGVRELRAEVHRRRRHARSCAGTDRPRDRQAELRRRRRDGGRLPRAAEDRQASRSTRRRSRRTASSSRR